MNRRFYQVQAYGVFLIPIHLDIQTQLGHNFERTNEEKIRDFSGRTATVKQREFFDCKVDKLLEF